MATKADEYRREAERADQLANTAPNETERETYRNLARRWREMAEEAQRRGC